LAEKSGFFCFHRCWVVSDLKTMEARKDVIPILFSVAEEVLTAFTA
jgi:hypothetical protein